MNKSNNVLTDVVVYSMLVAGIMVMTRPGSQGPGLVTAFTNGYGNIIKNATGGGK